MQLINWKDFLSIELRVGKIIKAEAFPEARKPAYIITVNFGEEIGVKRSSAQITDLYSKEELVGKLIIGVVNFPNKQIGPIISECLITGFYNDDGHVVLAVPDKNCPLGTKLM